MAVCLRAARIGGDPPRHAVRGIRLPACRQTIPAVVSGRSALRTASSPGAAASAGNPQMPGTHGRMAVGRHDASVHASPGGRSRMCSGTSIATAAELLAQGRTRRGIAAAARVGDLSRLRRGVYASPDACEPARTAALHGGSPRLPDRRPPPRTLDVSARTTTVHVWLRRRRPRASTRGDAGASSTGMTTCGSTFGLPPVPQVLRQILGCFGVEEFFVALESALRKGLLSSAGLDWLRRHTNKLARKALALARATPTAASSRSSAGACAPSTAVRTQVVDPVDGSGRPPHRRTTHRRGRRPREPRRRRPIATRTWCAMPTPRCGATRRCGSTTR